MKLTVLTDNHTYIDQYYLGEPAVSYYIEDGESRILWDTGYSQVYLKNAEAMGIDLSGVQTIALSHSHNDHTGGLSAFPKQDGTVRLIACPNVFAPRRVQENGRRLSIGAPFTEMQAEKRFVLQLSDEPVKISPNITFLGKIPRTNDFENKSPVGERLTENGWIPDYMPEDSALVYEGSTAIFIITACSHAGICNILEYAKKVTGCSRIGGLIGGFHLFPQDREQERRTVEYLTREKIPELLPCHCTCFQARAALHNQIPVREVGVGLTLCWE